MYENNNSNNSNNNNYTQQRQTSYEDHLRRRCTPPQTQQRQHQRQHQQQRDLSPPEMAPCAPPRRQPQTTRDVCRASSPPPVHQRVYQRLPTPEPDVHEQVIVRPSAQHYIERIIERPRTPSPIVRTHEVNEPAKQPIYTCRVVDVEHRPRMRRHLSQNCLDGYERSHSRAYSQHQIPPAPLPPQISPPSFVASQPDFYSSSQSIYQQQTSQQQQPHFYSSQHSLVGNSDDHNCRDYYNSGNNNLCYEVCSDAHTPQHQFDLHQPGNIPLFVSQEPCQQTQQAHVYNCKPMCVPGSQQKKKKGFLGCFRGKKGSGGCCGSGSGRSRAKSVSIDEKSCVPLY